MIGRVLWFDITKGFGFVRTENMDVFVHYSKILAPEGVFRTLNENDVVEFELFYTERDGVKKPQAKDVKIIKEGKPNEVLRKESIDSLRGHSERPAANKVR